MQVRLVRYCDYGQGGQVVDLPPDDALHLIKCGTAEMVRPDQPPRCRDAARDRRTVKRKGGSRG